MDAIITITTTADSREALEHIGRRLLTKRLIACIQIVGSHQEPLLVEREHGGS